LHFGKKELPPKRGIRQNRAGRKNYSPLALAFTNISANYSQAFCTDMKAKIIITPKKAVLDPQGKTVQNALEHMGYQGISAVHVGKYLEIEVTGDKETIRKQIDEACHKFLSNPVIEDYRFELE
jgi:phosphoribosylformylglycinamidine synthase subunit PurS